MLHEIAKLVSMAVKADENEIYLWLLNGDAENLTVSDVSELITEWKEYEG